MACTNRKGSFILKNNIEGELPEKKDLMIQFDKDKISISAGGSCLLALHAADFKVRLASDKVEAFQSLKNIKSENVNGKLTLRTGTDAVVHLLCDLNFTDPALELKDIFLRFNVFPERPELWEKARKDFHWIPNIKSSPEHIASDAVFRSPVVMMMAGSLGLALIPDLALMQQNRPAPHYLDMRFLPDGAPNIEYGMANYETEPHQYYAKNGIPFLPCNSAIRFGCHLIVVQDATKNKFLRTVSNFLWTTYGVPCLASHEPQTIPFSKYAGHGYSMALKKLWVDGPVPETGGITLSTYYDKATSKWGGREFPNDLWFQSWFNNMRTAYGLYLWGEKGAVPEWRDRAVQIANLLIASPRREGLFSIIYKSHDQSWQASGQGGGEHLFHLPDIAWTALWLLRFTQDCAPVQNADAMLLACAETLLKLQQDDGSFPTRVFVESLQPDSVLNGSASEALPIWFLAEMQLQQKFPKHLHSIVDRAIQAGLDHIRQELLPQQKFEDFELYFSCSPKPLDFYDSISEMYGQNTLSMQWCAEAFRVGYLLFQRDQDLEDALFCADLLCLYQQVWNPAYMDLHAFGGFGVMNTDAEWNDARQAQCAETLANFYTLTGNMEYLQRAVAAARASFTLMAIEENRQVAPRNYRGTAVHFEIHGAMAENYGHCGYNARSYQSGFHWGTGSALCTAAILSKRFGDVYIDTTLQHSIGINGIVITHIDWDAPILALTIDALPGEQTCRGKIKSPQDGRIKEIKINGTIISVEGDMFEFG